MLRHSRKRAWVLKASAAETGPAGKVDPKGDEEQRQKDGPRNETQKETCHPTRKRNQKEDPQKMHERGPKLGAGFRPKTGPETGSNVQYVSHGCVGNADRVAVLFLRLRFGSRNASASGSREVGNGSKGPSEAVDWPRVKPATM